MLSPPLPGEMQAVEELQPRGVERVGAIGVGAQLEIGVGGIRLARSAVKSQRVAEDRSAR